MTHTMPDVDLEASLGEQIPCDGAEDCLRPATFRLILAHEVDGSPCPPDLVCDEHMAEAAREAAEYVWECEHDQYAAVIGWRAL